MKKKPLLILSALIAITLIAFGYIYYSFFRPLPYAKYQGTVKYRECLPTELSLWCGRLYLESGGKNYYLIGDESASGFADKRVELYGEITSEEYGSEVITIKRIWRQ